MQKNDKTDDVWKNTAGQNKRDRRNTVEDDMKCWVKKQPII